MQKHSLFVSIQFCVNIAHNSKLVDKNTKYMFMYYCQKSYITPNVKFIIHDLICYIKIEKKHKVMGV